MKAIINSTCHNGTVSGKYAYYSEIPAYRWVDSENMLVLRPATKEEEIVLTGRFQNHTTLVLDKIWTKILRNEGIQIY